MAVVAVFPLVNSAGQYEAPLDYSTGVEQGLVARGFYPQKLATPLTAPTVTTGVEYDATDSFFVVKTEGSKISLQIGGNEYAWLSNTGELNSVSFKANAASGAVGLQLVSGAKISFGQSGTDYWYGNGGAIRTPGTLLVDSNIYTNSHYVGQGAGGIVLRTVGGLSSSYTGTSVWSTTDQTIAGAKMFRVFRDQGTTELLSVYQSGAVEIKGTDATGLLKLFSVTNSSSSLDPVFGIGIGVGGQYDNYIKFFVNSTWVGGFYDGATPNFIAQYGMAVNNYGKYTAYAHGNAYWQPDKDATSVARLQGWLGLEVFAFPGEGATVTAVPATAVLMGQHYGFTAQGSKVVSFRNGYAYERAYIDGYGTLGHVETARLKSDAPAAGRTVTNYALQSQAFNTVPWYKYGAGGAAAPTVTENNVVAPDGTTTASTVSIPAVTAGQYSVLNQTYACANGYYYCFSIWLKAAAPGTTYLYLYNNTSNSFRRVAQCSVTTSWQRFYVSGQTNSTSLQFNFGVDALTAGTTMVGQSAITLHVWGAQLEHNATFPSQYVPTTTASASATVNEAAVVTTQNLFTTGKLQSWKNQDLEKASLDYSGNFYARTLYVLTGSLIAQSGNPVYLTSGASDGSTAAGVVINTQATFNNSASKLLQLYNNNIEKIYFAGYTGASFGSITDGTRTLTFGADSNNPWVATSTAHDLRFGTSNQTRWTVQAAGHLLAASGYNITTTGALSVAGATITTNGLTVSNGHVTLTNGNRVVVGTGTAGYAAVFGNRNHTDAAALNYGAYFAYDCYWDDTADKWMAQRTTLGTKLVMTAGYHDGGFRWKTYSSGGTGDLVNGWADADMLTMMSLNAGAPTSNAIFATLNSPGTYYGSSKLLSLQNNTVEKAYFLYDGTLVAPNAMKRWYQTATLPVVVGDYVEIGSFNVGAGGHAVQLSVVVSSSGFSVAKHYTVSAQFNQTSNTYKLVVPDSTSGQYAGQDYDLELNVSNTVLTFRLRRTAGTTAGTAYITVLSTGVESDAYTALTGTGTSIVTDYFNDGGTLGVVTGYSADSSSAVGVVLDTKNPFATSGAKIASFRTAGSEKAYIAFDGSSYFSNTVTSATRFIAGSTGYQAGVGLSLLLQGRQSSSDTAVNVILDTLTIPYTHSGSKLLSIRNAGVEQAYFDYNGALAVPSAAIGGFGILAGIADRTSSTLSFVDGTRVFTLAPVGSFVVWANNVKYTKSTNQTVTIPNTVGEHFIYFNASGTLVSSTTSWNVESDQIATVATIYWDGTKGVVGDERHGAFRNRSQHAYLHNTRGTAYQSGLAGTFTDTTLSVTSGIIWDEDIKHDLSGTYTTCRLWYRTTGGTVMTSATASATPYSVNAGTLRYDNAGVLTAVGVNGYVVNWVYATNDKDYPIAVVVSQEEFTTLGQARAATQPSFPNLTTREWKLLYSVMYRNAAGTPTFTESVDYRNTSSLPNATVSSLPAIAVTVTPFGTIAATNVQAVLEEIVAEAASVSGLDTELQFNNSGVFGGTTGVTYDAATHSISVVDTSLVTIKVGVNEDGSGIDLVAADQGDGVYSDIGFYASRPTIGNVIKLEARDSRSQLQLYWPLGAASESLEIGSDAEGPYINGFGGWALPTRIYSDAELHIHSVSDVNIWSDSFYVEIGPPNSVTGTPGVDSQERILQFRDFDQNGNSNDIATIKTRWIDIANGKARLMLSSTSEDVGVEIVGGIVMRSPDGTIYLVTINNDGSLVSTEISI